MQGACRSLRKPDVRVLTALRPSPLSPANWPSACRAASHDDLSESCRSSSDDVTRSVCPASAIETDVPNLHPLAIECSLYTMRPPADRKQTGEFRVPLLLLDPADPCGACRRVLLPSRRASFERSAARARGFGLERGQRRSRPLSPAADGRTFTTLDVFVAQRRRIVTASQMVRLPTLYLLPHGSDQVDVAVRMPPQSRHGCVCRLCVSHRPTKLPASRGELRASLVHLFSAWICRR